MININLSNFSPQEIQELEKQIEDYKKHNVMEAYQVSFYVKFTYITRTICPVSGVHYLDAISDKGEHYTAQMETGVEKWITWKEMWKKNNQQPLDI
jgi:hypothetical protein